MLVILSSGCDINGRNPRKALAAGNRISTHISALRNLEQTPNILQAPHECLHLELPTCRQRDLPTKQSNFSFTAPTGF
jgi:hypothetical protein